MITVPQGKHQSVRENRASTVSRGEAACRAALEAQNSDTSCKFHAALGHSLILFQQRSSHRLYSLGRGIRCTTDGRPNDRSGQRCNRLFSPSSLATECIVLRELSAYRSHDSRVSKTSVRRVTRIDSAYALIRATFSARILIGSWKIVIGSTRVIAESVARRSCSSHSGYVGAIATYT